MATMYEGGDLKPVEIMAPVSKKEQKFLDILKDQNISEFIKYIKKSKIDHFNKPVPGLNIILLLHAIEKIYSKDSKNGFHEQLFNIALHKTHSDTFKKFNENKYRSSIVKYALKTGRMNENYILFIKLIQHYKKDFINDSHNLLKSASNNIDLEMLGLNKKDALFFFNNSEFYKTIINTSTSLYKNFFDRFSEYDEHEVSQIARFNAVDIFKEHYFFDDFKNTINVFFNTWLKYSFENPGCSQQHKDKACAFIQEKYNADKENNHLNLSLEYIGLLIHPMIEKEAIEKVLQHNDNPETGLKKRL